MTLTRKRQTVFPLDWCRQQGLTKGGPLNVFDLGDAGLLVRPVKPPSATEIRKLLAQTPGASIRGKRQLRSLTGLCRRRVPGDRCHRYRRSGGRGFLEARVTLGPSRLAAWPPDTCGFGAEILRTTNSSKQR